MAKYPHVKNEENPLSTSWEKCVTDDGQTNKWPDEQDWFYRTSSAKTELWSCFSKNIDINFLILFSLILSHMETMLEKETQST